MRPRCHGCSSRIWFGLCMVFGNPFHRRCHLAYIKGRGDSAEILMRDGEEVLGAD